MREKTFKSLKQLHSFVLLQSQYHEKCIYVYNSHWHKYSCNKFSAEPCLEQFGVGSWKSIMTIKRNPSRGNLLVLTSMTDGSGTKYINVIKITVCKMLYWNKLFFEVYTRAVTG